MEEKILTQREEYFKYLEIICKEGYISKTALNKMKRAIDKVIYYPHQVTREHVAWFQVAINNLDDYYKRKNNVEQT